MLSRIDVKNHTKTNFIKQLYDCKTYQLLYEQQPSYRLQPNSNVETKCLLHLIDLLNSYTKVIAIHRLNN